jgi:ankyrin repeat protein
MELVKEWVESGTHLHGSLHGGFLVACYWGKLEVVKYLVRHGADPYYNSEEALRLAIRHGRYEVVEYLKKKMLLEKLQEI